MHYLILDVHDHDSTADWMLYTNDGKLQDLGIHVRHDSVTVSEQTKIIMYYGGSIWFFSCACAARYTHVCTVDSSFVAYLVSCTSTELPMFSSLEKMGTLLNVPLDRHRVGVGVYTSIFIQLCLVRGRKMQNMFSSS